MSFFTGSIYSNALAMDTTIGVILPHDSRFHLGLAPLAGGVKPSKKPKTLILHHGLSDNHSVWGHRTSILRYAEEYDIAVLMPEVQRSFYNDMKYGPNYFAYVSKELPKLAAQMFNISTKPEDLIIAGLSMGGYGAMYTAMTYPEKFYGVGCFSSGFDIRAIVGNDDLAKGYPGWDRDRLGIFGEPPKIPDSRDPYLLVEKAAKAAKRPRVYMACGTEDFLYESNVRMRSLIKKTGAFDLKYEEWPGIHEWGFWDAAVQKMLKHFLG